MKLLKWVERHLGELVLSACLIFGVVSYIWLECEGHDYCAGHESRNWFYALMLGMLGGLLIKGKN